MDLMLDYNAIEWQGTLRKTFEKYFHPEVIDKESPELYQLLGSGKVPDLFQFSTQLGQSVIKKVQPKTLVESTAINSIMRLMSDGKEQPIDTFTRFKNDLSLWYAEMDAFGLTKDEQKIFEEHLLKVNGVADSQEKAMLLTMDRRIAGFDLYQATKLRKSISKKKKEAAEASKEEFFKQGTELGTRINVLKYAWHQIERMLGYSFSDPHVLAYTLIAFEQLNIFNYYDPLFWQTACLTINSGSIELDEDDKKKDKNYGKVAEAIGKLKNYGVNVALPDINVADISFKPDIENNRIVYSLKGISGMNDETAKIVIENRPYTSFEDFYERIYKNALLGYDEDGKEIRGGLIKRGTMLNLIKAGAFNSFCSPVDAMTKFVYNDIDVKETLTMQNIKSIIRLGVLNKPDLQKYLTVYYLRDKVKKQVHSTVGKEVILKLNPTQYLDYERFLLPLGKVNESIVEQRPNCTLIKEKAFEKQYKLFIEPLRNIIASPEFVREYNIAQFYEVWDKVAVGTVEKWEMDSVTYYSDKHELDVVDYKKYNISNFFEIDPTPEVIETYTWNDREYQKYQTYTLIGTCVDRNKDKHTFSLLTPDGVVTCKMYAGNFSHYDKAITKNINGVNVSIEKSWFTRGNLLLVRGYRREDQFVLKTNAQQGQKKQHTINLITAVTEDGELYLKTEREN